MRQQYELIQAVTEDGLQLSGLLTAGDKKRTAFVFIHGFTTDFYSHAFYHSITRKLKQQSSAIILGQTRGTGLHTEFLKENGEAVFIGSYFESIEESHLDITAFVEFLLAEGYQDIALIGHSLGTIKAVRYLFEGKHKNKISKLVLLAPFDKNAFMERKAPGRWQEFLEVAKQKIADGHGEDLVPVPEYEDYQTSYQTFYSWYHQDDLNCFWDFYRKEYDFPILSKIKIPTLVVIGEKDEFVTYPEFGVDSETALKIIHKHVEKAKTVVIPNVGHTFIGGETELASVVSNWIC